MLFINSLAFFETPRKVWNSPTYNVGVGTSGQEAASPAGSSSSKATGDEEDEGKGILLRDEHKSLVVQVRPSKSYLGPPGIKVIRLRIFCRTVLC